MELLADQLTEDGRYGEAIEVAGMAVRAEPLRESAQLALISAYRMEGNLVEALRQYAKCRQILNEELGLEPGARLQDVVFGSNTSRATRLAELTAVTNGNSLPGAYKGPLS